MLSFPGPRSFSGCNQFRQWNALVNNDAKCPCTFQISSFFLGIDSDYDERRSPVAFPLNRVVKLWDCTALEPRRASVHPTDFWIRSVRGFGVAVVVHFRLSRI